MTVKAKSDQQTRSDLFHYKTLLAQPWFTGTANSTERQQILQLRMQLAQEYQEQTVGTTSRDESEEAL
jgi:hypothetical protein